jgi:hypothetical protein
MWRRPATVALIAVTLLGGARAIADHLSGSYVVPLDDPSIQYPSRQVNDPVARLQARLDRGETKLDYHLDFGYLPSLLKNLNVPFSSQVLVFSKTSFQAARIYPRIPRALYFNDSVSVGYVRGGDVLELAAADPKQGIIFYTLDQGPAAPELVRRDDCVQCHASGSTLGVPGLLVRSVHPDRMGSPLTALGSFITDHRSPLKERWGGWYVSGTHGKLAHMGNRLYERAGTNDADGPPSENVTDLGRHLNIDAYLTPHSDIVALMVLEHQTRMQNLIIRVGWETRLALASQAAMDELDKRPAGEWSESTRRRIHGPVEDLVEYMLFSKEAAIEGMKGTTGYMTQFERQGPKDNKGRSLRQFDLTRRMFKYPCSYMIYSEAFDGMPEAARDRVYRRLWEVLTGQDTSAAFGYLTKEDRAAVLEILKETKSGLPDYWGAKPRHHE